MKKKTFMNKRIYLGLRKLEISEIVTYEFCYYYVKLKYREKAKLCYIDTDGFIVYIYPHNAKDVETRFHTSNYELERLLPKGKIKVIGLINDELGGKIMPKLPHCDQKHIAI